MDADYSILVVVAENQPCHASFALRATDLPTSQALWPYWCIASIDYYPVVGPGYLRQARTKLVEHVWRTQFVT